MAPCWFVNPSLPLAAGQPQGLSQNIRSLDHGSNSGEIAVRLKAIANASSYELRYAAVGVDNGGTALTWTTEAVTGVKTPVTLTGLRPATTDAFQVRSGQIRLQRLE